LIAFLLLISGIICFGYSIASASVAVLILVSLKELSGKPDKIVDFRISTLLIIIAIIIALPWHFLTELPCIRNYFPIWIIPVLAISGASAAPVFYIRSKVPEKWTEICVFTLCFTISVILSYFFAFTG